MRAFLSFLAGIWSLRVLLTSSRGRKEKLWLIALVVFWCPSFSVCGEGAAPRNLNSGADGELWGALLHGKWNNLVSAYELILGFPCRCSSSS